MITNNKMPILEIFDFQIKSLFKNRNLLPFLKTNLVSLPSFLSERKLEGFKEFK